MTKAHDPGWLHQLQPDLAAALPDVSADGLTLTIRIKPGLHYGPPLQQVEITAPDFVRSFLRLLSPALGSVLAYDFTDIEGAAEYNPSLASGSSGAASSPGAAVMNISGLEAPDAHTLRIRLTHPVGDFAARLAETGPAPLPPDPAHPNAPFGVAEGADSGYGRFLVSTGPYMMEGSDRLDFSVPAAQRTPVAGIAPGRITLVRNPIWDSKTDPLRPAYADRIEISLADSMAQAVAALAAGTADLLWPAPGNVPSVPSDVFTAFQADPKRGQVEVQAGPAVRSLIMNLAMPPFDDIHVRKALNWAIDKQALVDVLGGPSVAAPIGHLQGDSIEDGLLRDYDPYATSGSHGDLARAAEEMKLAPQYDTNGDGRCDVALCQHVPAVTRDRDAAVATAVAANLEALGIHLDVKTLDQGTFLNLNGRDKYAIYVGLGFHSLFIGPVYNLAIFDGRLYTDANIGNFSLLGTTPEQLKGWGYEGVATPPNVDARIEACLPLSGTAQFQCAAALDQYLMEYVVPCVPYANDRYVALASPRVVAFASNPLTGTTSLDRIALKP